MAFACVDTGESAWLFFLFVCFFVCVFLVFFIIAIRIIKMKIVGSIKEENVCVGVGGWVWVCCVVALWSSILLHSFLFIFPQPVALLHQ